MAKFKYSAKNTSGKEKKGEMVAMDKKEVVELLKKEGYFPTLILPIKEDKKKPTSFLNNLFTVPLKNKMIFCRHLAVMVASGLSLSKSLGILGEQEKNPTLKGILFKLREDVSKGVSFADAIAKYPKNFDSIFVSMIKMGELSGNLEEVLHILADQLEKDHKLISKVRGAMIYPAIIMVAMVVIGVLMMIFVIPKISGVFADFGAELPMSTKILLSISDFMASNALIVIGGMFFGSGLVYYFGKTSPGRKIYHYIFIKAPVIGPIVTKVNSARFSRILGSLLNSGTSLVEALEITADTLGNYYFKKVAKQASFEIQKGVTLSDVLAKHKKTFPYLIIQMVEVGEETGKTPDILKTLAGFYEEEVDQITKNLSSIIEPVLMLVIGGAVGLFAIAVIKPIYSVMGEI